MMLNWIRDNFHPLWHLRRNSTVFRWATQNVRIKIGVRIKNIDHKVYVDLLRNPHLVSSPNMYERQDLELMIDLIGRLKLKRMFDVGANLGVYAFTFSATAQEGRVVAFEPDLVNARLFEATNTRCPRHNVLLERKAVAESHGSALFLTDTMSGATGSLRLEDSSFVERNYGVPQPRTTVETTTIDDASKRFFPPDFIKIDVEGAELSVLEGACETLSKARPIMLVEIGSGKLQCVQEFLSKNEYIMRPTTGSNYLVYHQQSELCH